MIEIHTYGVDIVVWFEWSNRSVGHGKQCRMVCSCVEDVERPCLVKGIGV